MATRLPNNGYTLFDKGNGNGFSVEGMMGTDVRNNTDQNLRSYHIAIFGGWSTGSSLLDYANKGQPSGIDLTVDSVGETAITVTVSIADTGGLMNTYYVGWGDGTNIIGGDGRRSREFTTSSGGNYQFLLRGFEGFTEYFIQAFVENNFNKNNPITSPVREFQTLAPQLPTPSIGLYFQSLNEEDNIILTWSYGTETSAFACQTRIDEGNWNDATLVSSQNWGDTDNPKQGEWNPAGSVSPNDKLEARIRALGTSVSWRDSGWSQPVVIQEGSDEPEQ